MVLFRLSERLIGVVSTVLLARLLTPGDFGLVAMAMSLVAALEILSAFSFDISLIRVQNARTELYDTAWTFNVLFGLVNACLLLALAGPVAVFFQEPRVESIVRWLAVYAAAQGFANIGVVAFQKELTFHREFQLGMIKRLASFTITVGLAFTLRSYWALIVGTTCSALIGVLLSYRMHPFRPKFDLSGRAELFNFSKWMLLNNMLIYLIHRSTDLVIGRVAGSQALGTYNIAYEISNLPTTELVFPITKAVFPGYSQMAHDPVQIRNGFMDVLSALLILVVPAGLGIMAIAEPLVSVMLGERWTAAIPLVQILSIVGVLRASTSNTGAIYMALDRPRILTYLSLLYLALMGAALALLVPRLGAIGAAYAVLFAAGLQIPIGFVVLCRTINLSAAVLTGAMWRPLVSAILMTVTIAEARTWLSGQGMMDPAQLMILAPLGVAVYAVTLITLWMLAGRPSGGEQMLLPFAQSALVRLTR